MYLRRASERTPPQTLLAHPKICLIFFYTKTTLPTRMYQVRNHWKSSKPSHCESVETGFEAEAALKWWGKFGHRQSPWHVHCAILRLAEPSCRLPITSHLSGLKAHLNSAFLEAKTSMWWNIHYSCLWCLFANMAISDFSTYLDSSVLT